MKWMLAMVVALCCLVSAPAVASEPSGPEFVNEWSTMPPQLWSQRVRRARTTTTVGVTLLVPASVILVGGMGIAAVGDSDALLGAGLGGGFFGLLGTYPLYAGTGSLGRALAASGSPQDKTLRYVAIGAQVLGVVALVAAMGTGYISLLAVSLGFGAVHVNTSLALGFRALKRSRGLAETPVTARRMQWMPMLAPTRNRGVVAGLALRF